MKNTQSNIKKGIFLLCIIALIFLALLFKLSWGFFDGNCPTYSLNLIEQIASGIYPASFPGAPEVPANYHQGTMWITAQLSNYLAISPSSSLKVVILLFGTLSVIIPTSLALWKLSPTNAMLLIIAAYFSASFPNINTWPLTIQSVHWYSYISLFEYLSSPSWPIALSLFGVIAALSYNKKISALNFLVIALTLDALIVFFNAVVYSTGICTIITLILISIFYAARKKELIPLPHAIIGVCFLALALIVPRYATSAITSSAHYDPVKLALRIQDRDAVKVLLQYLQLHTFLNITTLIPAGYLIRKSKGITHHFLPLLYLICFFFPIIFWLKNVDTWDNLHKFVIFSSYLSTFIWISFIQSDKTSSIKKYILLGSCLTSLILSFPANYNQLFSRFQFARISIIDRTPSGHEDLRNFIGKQKQRVMFWAYPKPNPCGELSPIVDTTPAAFSGHYSSNFLLSKELEEKIGLESDWAKHSPKILQDMHPDFIHLYITKEESLGELKKLLEAKGISIEVVKISQTFIILADPQNIKKLSYQ